MSTRGCAGFKTEDGWAGVYNHFDSYSLHEEVWGEIKDRMAEGMTVKEATLDVIKMIKDTPQGFSSFPESPYAEGGDMVITSKNPDPLFIEYVVVLNPDTETMEVFAHFGTGADQVAGYDRNSGVQMLKHNRRYKYDGFIWYYGHCVYWHRLVATIDLNAEKLPRLRKTRKRELNMKRFPTSSIKFMDNQEPVQSRTRMDMVMSSAGMASEVLEIH
jgi:hypothetical protein